MTTPAAVSDEELFGPETCAWLDAFADTAPELDDRQVVLLTGLLRPDTPASAAA